MHKRTRVAITMGDAAGIGPEICLRFLKSSPQSCIPLIFGDAGVLNRVASAVKTPLETPIVGFADARRWRGVEGPCVVDFNSLAADQVNPGKPDMRTGKASFEYFNAAIEAAMEGHVDALTTAPISKEALHAANVPFPGHTEILVDRTGAKRACMMMTSEEITCSLVTTHIGYSEVPKLLTPARIGEVIELTADAMRRIRKREPRLAICGLNPHAGESGLFGNREEELLIEPAVESARGKQIDIIGPLPPDTAFIPDRRRNLDAYVCMYHDQALIPLKTLAFDRGVNVTLGLPIVRTSVDHGTANDIAWQGVAQFSSLVEAVNLAVSLSES